jgi:hypothetical protein
MLHVFAISDNQRIFSRKITQSRDSLLLKFPRTLAKRHLLAIAVQWWTISATFGTRSNHPISNLNEEKKQSSHRENQIVFSVNICHFLIREKRVSRLALYYDTHFQVRRKKRKVTSIFFPFCELVKIWKFHLVYFYQLLS